MIMTGLVRERLRVSNRSFIVNCEWLVRRQNLIFANVAEKWRAVLVCCFYANDFLIKAALVDLGDVRRLKKYWRVLVNIDD